MDLDLLLSLLLLPLMCVMLGIWTHNVNLQTLMRVYECKCKSYKQSKWVASIWMIRARWRAWLHFNRRIKHQNMSIYMEHTNSSSRWKCAILLFYHFRRCNMRYPIFRFRSFFAVRACMWECFTLRYSIFAM